MRVSIAFCLMMLLASVGRAGTFNGAVQTRVDFLDNPLFQADGIVRANFDYDYPTSIHFVGLSLYDGDNQTIWQANDFDANLTGLTLVNDAELEIRFDGDDITIDSFPVLYGNFFEAFGEGEYQYTLARIGIGVPEPASVVMLLGCVMGVACRRNRK